MLQLMFSGSMKYVYYIICGNYKWSDFIFTSCLLFVINKIIINLYSLTLKSTFDMYFLDNCKYIIWVPLFLYEKRNNSSPSSCLMAAELGRVWQITSVLDQVRVLSSLCNVARPFKFLSLCLLLAVFLFKFASCS